MYLIRENNSQNYKVGQSGNPEHLLPHLQTGNPRKLVEIPRCVIEVTDKSAAVDAAIKALRDYKCVLGGGKEWFTAHEGKDAELIQAFKDAVKKYEKKTLLS